MGAGLCALRPSDPSKVVDATMRSHDSTGENQSSNPAGTSTVAASLMLLIKSASCFKSSTSSCATALATGGVDAEETSKKKTQSSLIDPYVKEIVDKVMTKNRDHGQTAGTRTLGEWIIASPAPNALRKRATPWVPGANSSMAVVTSKSTKKRSLIQLRRGAHLKNDEDDEHEHAGDRAVLLISPTSGTGYNKYNNNNVWESMSSTMNNAVHHHDIIDGDDDDDSTSLCGARDSICIAKARRLIAAVQGRSASGCINHGSAAVKMKKKVSFRLPEEADIFFFYSPANNVMVSPIMQC